MVEIKYFKRFLRLFFFFQLFCPEVGGGSCQLGCGLTQTVQRERRKQNTHAANIYTCSTHLRGFFLFYVEHLGEGEQSQTTVIQGF